jgi:hypothetical protein
MKTPVTVATDVRVTYTYDESDYSRDLARRRMLALVGEVIDNRAFPSLIVDRAQTTELHEHEFQGQRLRHDHEGGNLPHGYFEHPEDGKAAIPALKYSGTSDDKWRTPFATAADYAAYAAARMNAAGGMDDIEAKADGSTVVIEVHDVPVLRAEFACTIDDCAQCDDRVKGLTLTELRRLVLAAGELWGNTERAEAAEYLSAGQMSVLDKAQALYRDLVEGI